MNDEELEQAAERFADSSRSKGTRTAYANQIRQFESFCDERGLADVPAEANTVRLYITYLARLGRGTSNINQALCALGEQHEAAGYPAPRFHPEVQRVWKGIKRTIGTRAKGMKPILVSELKTILEASPPDSLKNIRNRSVVSFGWAGALRRHEIADACFEHLEFSDRGYKLLIPRSKEDQEGQGFTKMVLVGNTHLCPMKLLGEWLEASGIDEGPLFRPVNVAGKIYQTGTRTGFWPQRLEVILKQMLRAADIDPKGYGMHSLRSGFITQAALNGASLDESMRHTGHDSMPVVRRYIRIADLKRANPTEGMGL